jgi:hypothetical protein
VEPDGGVESVRDPADAIDEPVTAHDEHDVKPCRWSYDGTQKPQAPRRITAAVQLLLAPPGFLPENRAPPLTPSADPLATYTGTWSTPYR